MPRAYSADLRERVLVAWERREGTQAVIAHRFSLALSTVENWLRQVRADGRRTAKPPAGGVPPRLDAGALEVLRQLVVQEDNAATLVEYADRLTVRTGIRVSPPVLCRALQRLRLPRKKRPSGRASRTGPRSPPNGRLTSNRSPRSAPSVSSSSTRAVSRRR
jgi:transposase